ncbi:MAG: antitoxin MazE family protein [Bifidobacteriaceae bacterium]|nr:antitoxin MazE family protein [Bifidobacteriaceae bacterium]
MAAHRARMRAQGYRELRLWAPDVRSARFAAEARRACLAMNQADAQDGIAEVA